MLAYVCEMMPEGDKWGVMTLLQAKGLLQNRRAKSSSSVVVVVASSECKLEFGADDKFLLCMQMH